MALLPWSRFLQSSKADGQERGNPQATGQGDADQVRWLPLQRHDQDSLARQRVQSLTRGLRCNQAGGVHFGQPNGLNASRFYAQLKGKTYQSLLLRRYHLC